MPVWVWTLISGSIPVLVLLPELDTVSYLVRLVRLVRLVQLA